MKKILIYPICLFATGAFASTTFYYEKTGKCSGLFLNQNATSCAEAVTKITPPIKSSKTFGGYFVNGTQVIDKNGNVLIDGSSAATLFNTNEPTITTSKLAEGAYTDPETITVQTHQSWMGESTNWYKCSVWGFHMCAKNGNYYAPPEVNCWSSNTWPCDSGGHNCKYDYVFNSYRMADDKTFVKASCYVKNGCNTSGNCWCNTYPDNLAMGDKPLSGGCSTYYLGPLSDGNYSQWKVYPFACKLFVDAGVYTGSVVVDYGRIELDNEVPGTCKYELKCDGGYTPSNTTNKSVQCEGLQCKGFFDGNVQTLINKGLTATCVPVN